MKATIESEALLRRLDLTLVGREKSPRDLQLLVGDTFLYSGAPSGPGVTQL
jgi:hypothetical protein